MTEFGKYLEANKISAVDAAEALGVTRAYVFMIISGVNTPALKLALRIKKWSGGVVTCESWDPWLKDSTPRKKRSDTGRKRKAG